MISALPYTANAASSTVDGSSTGKITGPMMVANAPYRAKSYHCTALPRHRGGQPYGGRRHATIVAKSWSQI